MRCEIDTRLRMIFSRAEGVLTLNDLREHRTRFLDDPDFGPHLCQLSDFREVKSFEISSQELKYFARDDPFLATSKRAFVVPNQLMLGMGNMYRIFSKTKILVTLDIAEAYYWLEIVR